MEEYRERNKRGNKWDAHNLVLGNALNSFYASNPAVSKNPSSWGINHDTYEKTIIDFYGVNRRGTDMPSRYAKMKEKL